MNVTCAECASIFRVDPAKVPVAGVRARCSVCGAVIAVAAPVLPDLGAQAEPAASSAMPTPVASLPAASVPAASVPAAAPVEPPRAPAPPVAAPVAVPVAQPSVPAAPVAPISPVAPTPPVAPRTPEGATEAAARVGPRITPRPEPTPAAPAAAQRRFNPYLSNDPSQKARRLARALVSDLVVYQPQKREEGLRAGTLKELFRDEIRKSWEEYVAQVGAPIAESTTHFQDALNDVLAGGRKIF